MRTILGMGLYKNKGLQNAILPYTQTYPITYGLGGRHRYEILLSCMLAKINVKNTPTCMLLGHTLNIRHYSGEKCKSYGASCIKGLYIQCYHFQDNLIWQDSPFNAALPTAITVLLTGVERFSFLDKFEVVLLNQ